jgi:thiaminase
MHESFCALWGVSKDELIATPESPTTQGYTSYILDAGSKGDALTLLVALTSCLLGYGEVANWLQDQAQRNTENITLHNNPYQRSVL